MALARSRVQFECDLVAVSLSDSAHRYSLGEVLTNEPVEVFIATSFPRMIGSCEVALHWKKRLQSFVVMELCAVVQGNCLELSFVLSQGVIAALITSAVVREESFLMIAKPDVSLNQGQNTVMEVSALSPYLPPSVQAAFGFLLSQDGLRYVAFQAESRVNHAICNASFEPWA